MTVRKLRAKQRGPQCSYCSERANWRGVYFTRFACDGHHSLLIDDDAVQSVRDSHHSEAEWGLRI